MNSAPSRNMLVTVVIGLALAVPVFVAGCRPAEETAKTAKKAPTKLSRSTSDSPRYTTDPLTSLNPNALEALKVPSDAEATQLVSFLTSLELRQAKTPSRVEYARIQQARQETAELLYEKTQNERHRFLAVDTRLDALLQLYSLADADAESLLLEFVEPLVDDPQSDVAIKARVALLNLKVAKLTT